MGILPYTTFLFHITIPMPISKIYITAIFALFIGVNTMAQPITTPIRESLRFDQVNHPEHAVQLIPDLPTLSVFDGSRQIIDKQSPLQTRLMVGFVQNTFAIHVTITNPYDYEWFLNTRDGFYFVDERGSVILEVHSEPPSELPDGMQARVAITDESFRLIRPGETLTFGTAIPAQWLYQNFKGQNVVGSFGANGIPPSIFQRLNEIYSAERSFDVLLTTNRIRIRCIGYDRSKDLYQCDFDSDYNP